ncbi:MAG: PEP-CTERM sorting domain-containing protein [Sphingomonadales bacterium]|nr:MAG: PEP-CTERM sorting domain-containing protein [Sphingomonadales bacterium]
MKIWFLALLALVAIPASAQTASPPAAAQADAKTILFIGNSFTFGAGSGAIRYRADTVTDLNGDGIGGVPALFKVFTEQAGLNWRVSLETQGGKSLAFHYEERRARLAGKWDAVVLQEYSTLDRDKPGDVTSYLKYSALLAQMAVAENPKAQVYLMPTWSRADKVYKPGSPWSGKPIQVMAQDLRKAADQAKANSPHIYGILPVGEAWNRAMAAGVADPNPYDGITFGQIDLWTFDQYHASVHGYYLEALIVFGRLTGVDPTTLGEMERAANELGISRTVAVALQKIASDELAGKP